MADTVVKNLITKLVLDDKGYKLGMKDASGQMVNMERVGKTLAIGIGAIGAAMGAAAGAAALLTKQTVAIGDKYDKLSQRIGISVEKLSAYNHLAQLSGTSLEGMATSVGRLSRNILDASEGVGEAKDAFERLGIEATDTGGNLKDADVVMMEIAERFKEMPDGAEKTALAMETMGRSGTAMIPMLNQGAEGMARMLDEGKQLRSWTEAEAAEAALLNDNFTRLKTAMAGVKDMIGKALIPIVQAVVQTVQEWSAGNRDLIEMGLAKMPHVIKTMVIPAFSTMLEVGNMVMTALKVGWHGVQFAMNQMVEFVLRDINALVQGIAKVGSKIPGIGKALQQVAFMTQAAYDTATEAMEKNAKGIDDALAKHTENKDKIAALQDALVIKYDESNRRMADSTTARINKELREEKAKAARLAQLEAEKNRKIEEERKAHHEAAVRAEGELADKIDRLSEDKYDYARIKLEQEYDKKREIVENKALLDDWYDKEWRRIQDAEEADLAQKAEEKKARDQEDLDARILQIEGYTDRYIEVLTRSGDLEKDLTKTTGEFVVGEINRYTQEKVRTVIEAAIKIVTGHVAEGLAMVGASGVTVWDAIANIGMYAAKIGGSIMLARTIARKVNLEEGGWLASHPRGGTINEGSTGRADDVLLAKAGGTDFYGSRGESVFVMNAEASRRFGPLLAGLNISTGFADGGLLGTISKAVNARNVASPNLSHEQKVDRTAKNLTRGLIMSVLGGWGLAGDWLQGIPFGVKDGVTDITVGIPAMFAGKAMGRGKMKNVLGFGLGGLIRGIIRNPFKAPSLILGEVGSFLSSPGEYLRDSFFELTSLLGKLTQGMIGGWMTEIISSIGMRGIANNLVSFEGKKSGLGSITSALTSMLNPVNFIKGILPNLDNGGMITGGGLVPLGTGGIPFAGVGQAGEVIVPPGKMGSSINITLMGIDRRNARRIVRDVIIPEINFYRSSKGLNRL